MKDYNQNNISFNPLVISAMKVLNPRFGDALSAGALEQRQQQLQQQGQEKHLWDQEDRQKQQRMEEALHTALDGVDLSNPKLALQQLMAKKIDPKFALQIINEFGNQNSAKEGHDIQRGNLDINRARLGLDQQELGLKQQKLDHELSGNASPEDAYKIEKDLRDAAAKETKNYKFVKTAVKNIIANSKHENAISDTAMAYNFVNVLDPGNSVREGDTLTIANAPGISEQWRAKLNKAFGGGGLDPITRREIIQSSTSILKNHEASVRHVNKDNERLAKSYKVKPENVIYPLEELEEETPLQNGGMTPMPNTGGISKEDALAELERRKRGL